MLSTEGVPSFPSKVTVYSVGVGGASSSKMALISTLSLGMVNLSSLTVTSPLITCHSLKW